jgi:hypothetical protein
MVALVLVLLVDAEDDFVSFLQDANVMTPASNKKKNIVLIVI